MANDVLKLDIQTAVAKLMKPLVRMARKLTGEAVVTIDVDSTGIRLLEISHGMVRRWASVSFDSERRAGEIAPPQQALGAEVRQLMASSGIKAKKVIASISGLYSVNRFLPVSSLPLGITTQEAVQEVAKEIMPLSVDKIYLSWQTVTVSEGEPQIIILGTPRETVDDEVRVLRLAGINPQVLELKTIALARAVGREQALILNIESSSLDVVVVADNLPRVMHTVAWQPGDFTEEEMVGHLATNLEMTADFYNSRNPESPLDATTPLFITGQMSTDLTLVEKLQAGSRYTVESLAPPLKYPPYLPVSQYATNIGLALRSVEPSEAPEPIKKFPLEMNLLPDAYRPWRPSARQVYSLLLILAAVALVFPIFQVAAEAMDSTAKLQAQYNMLNTRLELQKAEIKKREPTQKAVSEFRTIVNREGNFAEDLAVIRGEAENLGVQVSSTVHEGESITVACQADDYVTFRAYKTALEESGRFATPIPPPEGYPYTTGGTIELETINSGATGE